MTIQKILRQGLMVVFVFFLVVNCKKDMDHCAQLEEKYHIAGGEFWNHPGPLACVNYKTALLNYMNSGCLTEEQKGVLARQLQIANNPALCP